MSLLADNVAARLRAAAPVAVVLDPDEVLDPGIVGGEVIVVSGWWGLRAAYERHARRRDPAAGPVVLWLRGPVATRPLPWDIGQASTVVPIRLPGPSAVRAAMRELEPDEIDRAIATVARATGDRAAALLTLITGVPLTEAPPPVANQLRLAARVASRRAPSPAIVALAQPFTTDPMVAGLLDDPSDASGLQAAWDRFVSGEPTAWAPVFTEAALEVGQLFALGILDPVAGALDTRAWAAVGIRDLTDEEIAVERLAHRPQPFPPADLTGWMAVSEWWADIRRRTARAGLDLRQRAWAAWAEMDTAWVTWLRSNYGALLSSAARWPTAVHRVAPFLARRLREGQTDRVLLVVLDGLGLTQWQHLLDQVAFRVVEGGSTCALIPTYTTVSRQAIFTGDLPLSFPESLWTTHPEPRHWDLFWREAGVGVSCATYHRVKGRFPHDHIEFGAARAVGVVVNAVDDLMHTSELFGDAQLLANLDVWVANGFLDDLVRRATEAGFETWVTADHGNLECEPARRPSEGALIEAAGKRLLRYANSTLRDASSAEGIDWDDIPGLPPDAEALRMAPGRLAYSNHKLSVSHGGLSIDEVIVPLARVEP